MIKTVALFSGQGAQYVGMGQELYEAHGVVRDIYQTAKKILGYDLAELSFTGPEETLTDTLYAQPATFALSVAGWTLSKDLLGKNVAVAGHSLGEYAALYAAGAFSLEDGFRIIGMRGKAMKEAAENSHGAMTAILGLTEEQVITICHEVEGLVNPVNFNTENQTVISGEAVAVQKAAQRFVAEGGKAVPLAVSSAFHTPIMEPAARRFMQEIKGISYKPTQLPFYSNVTGGRLLIEDYPGYFAEHMTSSVKFTQQMRNLFADGITKAVEFGPKKTVIGFVKRTLRSAQVHHVEDATSFANLANFLEQ